MKRLITHLSVLAAAFIAPSLAAAELVDDFETCLPGPIDGQNGWVAADATSMVIVDPAVVDNQCLLVTTDSTWLSRPALLADETSGTLFLRLMIGEQQNFSFGLSDLAAPSLVHDFEVELNMSDATNVLRVNNGGMYEVIAALEPGVWYNAWIVVDNLTDDWQLFLHDRDGDHANAGDQLDADGTTRFDFRNLTAEHLFAYFIKTGGGSGPNGPLTLDDLYLSSDRPIDLQNPVAPADPAPAAGSIPNIQQEYVSPLLLDLNANREVQLTWDFSCMAGDTDYEIYGGTLDHYYSHERLMCSTAGLREATLTPEKGDRYYLVVPHNGEREGSYGWHTNGAERPPAADACLIQHVGECLSFSE